MFTEDNQQQHQNLQQSTHQQPTDTPSSQHQQLTTNSSNSTTLSSNSSQNTISTVNSVTPSHHNNSNHHHHHHHHHHPHHNTHTTTTAHQFRQVCFNPSTTKVLNSSLTNTLPSSSLNATTNPNSLITPVSTPSNIPQQVETEQQGINSSRQNSTSHKRLSSSSSSTQSSDSSKRMRLDNSTITSTTNTIANTTNSTTNTPINKTPKFIRKFRSRSLPIINFNSNNSAVFSHNLRRKHNFNTQQQQTQPSQPPQQQQQSTNTNNSSFSSIPPLPPINLQSLKEIDLHEILKNPQLRHDILFDPQLQFRPNLDGERGKRKKSIIDKYWLEIQKECQQFFTPNINPKSIKINRLPILFTTLRDILLSLLPTKDRSQVNEIMDIDLLIQQLRHGSFDFVEMSKWLADVFKSHCAPMRDQWVMEMNSKFIDSYNLNSVSHLIGGLRMIFQILEAMKLDVANHQIRILRPVLIETAIDFEKDYFQTLINHNKININDSLNWFYKKFLKKLNFKNPKFEINEKNLKPIIISSIIDLLSCRQMATEFPSTLTFDHTRLVLLRADVRQLVCVQLCIVLYKQLIVNSKSNIKLLSQDSISKVQQEILAIVTDDNGNIKWTKNINSISIQLVKNLNLGGGDNNDNKEVLPQNLIDFSHNWLMKHIQPNSEVYGLMEIKIFKELMSEIMNLVSSEDKKEKVTATTTNSTTSTNTTSTTNNSNSEMKNIATRISTLVNFHWNVFGSYYLEYIQKQYTKQQIAEEEEIKKQQQKEKEKQQQQLQNTTSSSSSSKENDSVILDHQSNNNSNNNANNNNNQQQAQQQQSQQNQQQQQNGEIDTTNSAPLSLLS
ncbi:SOK1 [Candida pseudojiufengensis]|uniref:SOK1 n=1 Tax=Candida pseudojiufengensis TaxID=497109 RepID=UPI0022259AB6|nr:SOK1 [Candida pseudojiufengensis]KAI5962538.1 SOK1 [Candida pseudojiufengensis]